MLFLDIEFNTFLSYFLFLFLEVNDVFREIR